MNNLNVLSTYIFPESGTVEDKVNNILLGSTQVKLMGLSIRQASNNVNQHLITNGNLKIRDCSIYLVHNVNRSELTLDILRHQRDFFDLTENGTQWIVCDPDFLFFKDIKLAFDNSFDVAITRRSSSSMPYNSGIFLIRNSNRVGYKFFDIQVRIIESHFMSNAKWFGDQLVLKYIIDNADQDKHGIFCFEGLRIKLIDADEYNYSPNREHPNLFKMPDVSAYHFKGRCRSYMPYFFKHYVRKSHRPWYWMFAMIFDFILVELERKKVKPVYEEAKVRHRPNS